MQILFSFRNKWLLGNHVEMLRLTLIVYTMVISSVNKIALKQ